MIPVMRPQLPTADEILPYLRRIDEARYYTNFGSLLRELESRFATFYSLEPREVSVVANGTVALSALLLATGARAGSRCLMPSWTFVASAAAAWAANLRPHFIDVDENTWMLDPKALARRADLGDVGAVMVVSPFGAPVDTKAWDEFTGETGIPVIIDCAASFDSVHAIPKARPGRAPMMISLHATKSFGVGEGALVLTTDESLAQRFRQICNFGVWGTSGQILGYNGKESEYHCAVGLAMLDIWDARRPLLASLTERYVAELATVSGVEVIPTYGDGWVSCYCNIKTSAPAAHIMTSLRDRGVETRQWWRNGVHVQEAYSNFSRDALPVTEHLAAHVFGLPFYHDITPTEFDRVLLELRASVA